MAMTVTLYKNCGIDGITRLGRWSTLSAQISYLNKFSPKTYTDVPTVRLGESLRLEASINDLIEYNYGSIDFGDGFKYFFSVADLAMRTETITDVSYTLDVWDTVIAQIGNPVTRAIITRYSQPKGITNIPYNPISKTESQKGFMAPGAVIALYWNSKNNNIYTMLYPITNLATYHNAISGNWYPYDNETWPATGVLSCGIVPYTFSDLSGWIKIESVETTCYYSTVVLEQSISNPFSKSVLTNTGTQYDEIRDLRGNVVFTCPYQEKLTYNKGTIDVSASSIQIRLTYYNESNKAYEVVIPAEYPTLYADAWQEYQARQREIDIETRNLQINQQLYTGIANSATSAAMGAVMGPVGGLSAGTGAAVGGGSGLISSLGNYAIQSIYAPKQQAIVDKTYKYANDTLSTCGSASFSIYRSFKCGLFTVTWDDESLDTYNYDIDKNGYYTFYVPDDPASSLTDYAGPITADVDVTGPIPTAWKEQIHTRFLNGVVFV